MAEIKNINCSVTQGANGNSIVTKNIADLNLSKSVKIKKAVVPLTVISDNLPTDAVFDVTCKLDSLDCGLIDRLSGLTQGQEIKINITDELQKAIESNTIQLIINFTDTDTDNPTIIKFEKTVDNDKETSDIEYISKAEYSANGTSHSVDLGSAGQVSVNLSTGMLNIVHQDVQSDSNVLPLSISHVYNSFGTKLPNDASISNYYGEGWKLNLEQYLVEKTINIPLDNGEYKEQPTGEYEYFDENGRTQVIVEKYYYNTTNEDGSIKKNYIERTDPKLSMNLDGELQYNKGTDTTPDIVPIETEWEAPSGLKLVTKKADIKGANLVDTEPDELLQLREQHKNLKLNESSLSSSIYSNKQQLIALALSRKAIKIQLEMNDYNLKSSDEELRLMQNVKQDRRTVAYTDLPESSTHPEINTKLNKEDWLKSYGGSSEYSTGGTYTGTQSIQNSISDLNKQIYQTGLSKENLSTIVKEEISEEYFKQVFTDGENLDLDYIQDYFDEIKNINKNIDNMIRISEKDLYTIDIQVASIVEGLTNYEEQLQECCNQLKKLENQIANYERQIPQFYLYSDNAIYGFSPIITEIEVADTTTNEVTYTTIPHIYRLNYITDTYENSIVINYEKNTNKIENIIDSQDNVISFEYKTVKTDNNTEENHIIITDAQDKQITLVLQADRLAKVEYIDGTTSKYLYDINGKLVAAIGANGIGAKFTYNSNKVTEIKEIFTLSNIQDGEYNFDSTQISASNLDTLPSSKQYINIEYKNCDSTIISSLKTTDDGVDKLKSLTYVFDNEGRVRTVYENSFVEKVYEPSGEETEVEDPNANPVVKSFDYVADKKQISVEPLLNSKNYMDDVCFDDNAAVPVPANYFGNGLLEGDEIYCGDDIYCETYLVHMQFHSYTKADENFNKSLTVSTTHLNEIKSLVTDATNPQTHFILGGWAKADSAFVFNPDTDGDIENYPTYIQNRKFELRAEITYTDTTTATFKKCFDWLNTEWQYCAVPIEFDKSREISSIVCYFDYSNNTITESSPVYFTDFTLKEASFEECTYNNKLLTEVISSHSKWKQVCEYDDNDKLIKLYYYDTTSSDAEPFINEFYYNKNGKLFKTIDYKGVVTEKVFNENGIEIQTKKYHKDNPAEIMFTEQKLGEKGEVLADYNELGEEINSYEYVSGTGIVSTVADKQGNKTAYGYDTKNGTLLQMSSDVDGVSNTNTYGYTLNFLTKVSHNDFDITYDYDSRGRISKIKVAGNDYLRFTYDDENNSTTTNYYKEENNAIASFDFFRTVTDKNGNVKEVYYKENETATEIPVLENIYDTFGNLITVNDKINGTTIQYTLDKFGNTTLQADTQHEISVQKENTFDANNNNTAANYTIGTEYRNYDYEYDISTPESVLKQVSFSKGNPKTDDKIIFAAQSIKNDNLERTHEITLTSGTKTNTRLFHYLKNGLHTSNQVSSIWFGYDDKYLDNLKYKYDEKGNITEVYENSILQVRYKYDSLSRLIREDNKPLNKTTTWEYDAGGNIINRKEYPFETNESLEMYNDERLFSAEQLASGMYKTFKFIPYSYATSGIRDKLMSYGNNADELNSEGIQFEYDAIGNPKTYRGKTYKWSHGRQLDAIGIGLDENFIQQHSYTYNANGIRISKTMTIPLKQVEGSAVDGTMTLDYFLDGNKIISQQDVANKIFFIYGVDGIAGFSIQYNNTEETYYYKKNLQGDIIGLYNSAMVLIAKYEYDAWGNHIVKYLDNSGNFVATETDFCYNDISNINRFIANKNPFRYRSYYYDFETGLYYLNSRYYDPEIGRFINIDEINVLDVTNIALNGINLYAYCLNNPVNEVDESGYFVFWLLFLVAFAVGFVVSGTVSVVSQGIKNGWNNINWWQAGWDALMGGIGGIMSVTGLGVLGMTISGAVIGFVSSVGSNLIAGSDFSSWQTWLDIGLSTGFGALFGRVGRTGATNAEVLDSALHSSAKYLKAAASYDKVLTKIATGQYKTLAGAAGARALTRTTLQKAWQGVVAKTAWKNYGEGLWTMIPQSIIDMIKAIFI